MICLGVAPIQTQHYRKEKALRGSREKKQ